MKTTKEQKTEILERFDRKCAYCGVKLFLQSENKNRNLTVDHFIPSSRGGSDKMNNLVASCRVCNAAKGNLKPEAFCKSYNHYQIICAKLATADNEPVAPVSPAATFRKSDTGKPPLAHLGDYAKALAVVCHIAEYGAKKYGRNNWRKCDDLERYRNALTRHLFAYLSGEWADADHGHAHLGAVAWNALVLLELDKESSCV